MTITPRSIAALAISGAFVSASLPAAESGPYIRLDNGVQSISGADLKVVAVGSYGLTFKPAYIFGGAVGYRINEMFATEVELDYSQTKLKSVDGEDIQENDIKFRQTSVLLAGVYNHKLNATVTLNLGAGVGVQFSSNNLPSESVTIGAETVTGRSKSDAALLAQLKTGVSVALAKNVSFDVGYKLRFVGTSDVYEASITGPNKGSSTISLGSRLNHVFSGGVTLAF
jgi:opacity protein-like surface antigen